MLATAQAESSLNPQAASATSSARGLYQFIDQTWLATLKRSGPALGYGRYADAIAQERVGPLRRARSDHAPGHHGAARRSYRERRHGGRADARQRRSAVGAARPLAKRRRALHRALPRRRRRGAADLVGGGESQCQRGELFPDCSTCQCVDLLRPLDGRAAQSRRGAQRSHRALRRGGAVAAQHAGEHGRTSRYRAKPRASPRAPSLLPVLRPPTVRQRITCALFLSIRLRLRLRCCCPASTTGTAPAPATVAGVFPIPPV